MKPGVYASITEEDLKNLEQGTENQRAWAARLHELIEGGEVELIKSEDNEEKTEEKSEELDQSVRK